MTTFHPGIWYDNMMIHIRKDIYGETESISYVISKITPAKSDEICVLGVESIRQLKNILNNLCLPKEEIKEK